VNVSLICKWWWALENEDDLWQDIVRLKYVKIRHIYLKGRGIKINNGQNTSFWLDHWMGDPPLCQTYPILYEEAINKNCWVLNVRLQGWVVQFRSLKGVIREQWYALAIALNNFLLNESKVVSYWKWNTSKSFTVKTV
jgi:hypothetical protein